MIGHLSPAEFAEAVGHDPATVRRWLRERKLKATRIGDRGFWWIPESEVARLLGRPAPQSISRKSADDFLKTLLSGMKSTS